MSKQTKQQNVSAPKSGTLEIPQDLKNALPVIPTPDTNGSQEVPFMHTAPAASAIGSTAKPLTLAKKDDKKGGRGRPITVLPGETHVIKIGEGDKAVEVPFQLPPECTQPTKVSIAASDIGWIGREGVTLRAHVCLSENGAVILMPQTDGSWKANAFSKGRITHAAVNNKASS